MEPSQKKAQNGQSGDDTAQTGSLRDQASMIMQLEAKIRELAEQNAKFTDLAARAQADLQNAKVRLERDSSDMRKFAAESVVRRLLPTVDNIQRASRQMPEGLKSDEWVKGMLATTQELLRQLKDLGLQEMESLGQPSDPSFHEILMEGPGEKGKVIEVFDEGYVLSGKVIRPAKVKVGNGEVAGGTGVES